MAGNLFVLTWNVPKVHKWGVHMWNKDDGTQGIESASGERIANCICLGKCNTRRRKVWTNGGDLKTFVQKKILRNHKGKNSVVQAITLQPWRRSSRQTLAASEEALDQPWLAGRPWINLGVRAMPSLGVLHTTTPPGDRNYSCTLCKCVER